MNVSRLAGVEVPRKARMVEITLAECERVREWLADHVLLEEAMELLGVRYKLFQSLLEAGLFLRLNSSPESTRGYYSRNVIVDLLKRVRRGASTVEACPSGCASVVDASRPFYSVADIVQALLDGRLDPVGVLASRAGLAAIVVRSSDVVDVATQAAGGMISGVEAALMLGMSSTVTITKAIEYNLLSATYPGARTKKAGRLLRLAEVVQFDRDYVMGKALLKGRLGVSRQKLESFLRAAGVIPVFRGEARGTLYVRSEAERALEQLITDSFGRSGPRLPSPSMRDANGAKPAARQMRRTFTPEFRAAAVEHLTRSNEGVRRAALDLGITVGQLYRWRNK